MIPPVSRDPRPRSSDPQNERRFMEIFRLLQTTMRGSTGGGATSLISFTPYRDLYMVTGVWRTIVGRRIINATSKNTRHDVTVTWAVPFDQPPIAFATVEEPNVNDILYTVKVVVTARNQAVFRVQTSAPVDYAILNFRIEGLEPG